MDLYVAVILVMVVAENVVMSVIGALQWLVFYL